MITNQEAINILLNERKCIDRNDGVQCDRKCELCDLVMDAEPIREAYNMAISVLQAQDVPDTNVGDMKSCIYCHEDSDGYVTPIEKNCHAFIRFGMDGWELSLKAKGWHGSAKIKYCPMCGRRLTDG